MSFRFAIIASEYNSVIMDRLIDGARRALKDQEEVRVIRVPGAFEIHLAAKRAASSKKYDGIVALGLVVRRVFREYSWTGNVRRPARPHPNWLQRVFSQLARGKRQGVAENSSSPRAGNHGGRWSRACFHPKGC
jgi:hypothetical protein